MTLFERKYSLEDLKAVARQVLLADPLNKIFLFEGDMGSGKTTLIKEICRQLGSEDNFSSPTFSIVNDYSAGSSVIHHFDLYRLNDAEELYDIGFEEYLGSGNYCLIEWPEKARPFLDGGYLRVALEATSETERIINLTRD